MTWSRFLKLYGIALPIFLVIDFIWLRLVARSFYQAQIGHLMRAEINWAAAGLFYLIFVVGIVVLAVWPGGRGGGLAGAGGRGALLGLVTYAAYVLTNLAVLAGFPLGMAVVDMLWGALLCATVSTLTYLLGRRWALFNI